MRLDVRPRGQSPRSSCQTPVRDVSIQNRAEQAGASGVPLDAENAGMQLLADGTFGHRMISSARASTAAGMVWPSAFASSG